MPRKPWNSDAPDLSVKDLDDRETPIKSHFTKPEVQYVGSTSSCGCDFGSVIFQNGDWPWFDDFDSSDEVDVKQLATERYNREKLVAMLRATGEQSVEVYGVWDGNFDFKLPPRVREEVQLPRILDREFRFKEQGFYIIQISEK